MLIIVTTWRTQSSTSNNLREQNYMIIKLQLKE